MAKKPDLELKAFYKSTGYGKLSKPIGVGWKNEDGSISIQLNPFTTLQASADLVLTLFPQKEFTSDKPGTIYPTPIQPDDDDIPF